MIWSYKAIAFAKLGNNALETEYDLVCEDALFGVPRCLSWRLTLILDLAYMGILFYQFAQGLLLGWVNEANQIPQDNLLILTQGITLHT